MPDAASASFPKIYKSPLDKGQAPRAGRRRAIHRVYGRQIVCVSRFRHAIGKQRRNDRNQLKGTVMHPPNNRLPPPRRDARSPHRLVQFCYDFMAGFGTLIAALFLLFVCLPLIMIAFKIGVIIAVPMLYLGVFVVLVALLGRLVRLLLRK